MGAFYGHQLFFRQNQNLSYEWQPLNFNIPLNIGKCYLQEKGYSDRIIMKKWINDIWKPFAL